jgi:creatinine amidohydrolase
MAELTRVEYERRLTDAVILLPVGSTEQHGPHLPLGTDAIQVEEIAVRVAERVGGLVAPTLPYGYRSGARTGGGEIFSGTTSLSAEALIYSVRDILVALMRHGSRRIVVLDGHYENSMFLEEAIHLALAAAEPKATVLKLLWADAIAGDVLDQAYPQGFPGWALEHAAHLETSTIGFLRPPLLDQSAIRPFEGEPFPPYDIYPQPEGFVPATGVLSDPSRASPESGRTLIDGTVDGLVEIINQRFGPAGNRRNS